jgi:hypothetical protein
VAVERGQIPAPIGAARERAVAVAGGDLEPPHLGVEMDARDEIGDAKIDAAARRPGRGDDDNSVTSGN